MSFFFVSWCQIIFFPCISRREESLIVLLAASQHLSLVLMDVLVPETAPNRGGGPVQKSPRRHDVLAQLQLLVPQRHLSHLHTLPIMKASSTAKRPPPLTLKLSREALTGTTTIDKLFNRHSLHMTAHSNSDSPIVASLTKHNRLPSLDFHMLKCMGL